MTGLPPLDDDFGSEGESPKHGEGFDEDLFVRDGLPRSRTTLSRDEEPLEETPTAASEKPVEASELPPEGAVRVRRFLAYRDNFECLAIAILLALAIRHFVFEPFQIPTGSMATTLLGKHRLFTCEHCDWTWAVKDGEGRVVRVPDDCPHCRLDVDPQDTGVWHGEKILANKMVYYFREPRRWESCVFRPPHKDHVNFIKRIISAGGEKISIRGGDVYVNDEISTKPRDVQDQIWIPVYDAAHDIPEAVFFESEAGWERDHTDGGAVYRYDDLKDRLTHVLEWARAEGGGSSSLGRVRQIFSELSYNNELTGRVVGDLKIDTTLSISDARNGVVGIEILDGPQVLRLELGAGARLIRKRGEEVVSEHSIVAALPSTRDLEVSFRNWDEHVLVTLNGEDVLDLQLDPLEDEFADEEGAFRIDARDTNLTVANLKVWRDIHYSASDQPSAFGRRERHWDVPEDMLLVLGDNTDHSNDSRDWGYVPRDNLRGRPWLRLLHIDLARISDTDWDQVKFGHVE